MTYDEDLTEQVIWLGLAHLEQAYGRKFLLNGILEFDPVQETKGTVAIWKSIWGEPDRLWHLEADGGQSVWVSLSAGILSARQASGRSETVMEVARRRSS